MAGMCRDTLEDRLEAPVVVLVQPSRLDHLLSLPYASVLNFMIGCASCHYRQARIVPEGALRPEAPGRFHCWDDLRNPHWPEFRYLAQHPIRRMPLALGHHCLLRRSFYDLQLIQLLEEQFGSGPLPLVGKLFDPALALACMIQLAPSLLDRLAVVERFQPVLHPGDVFDQTFITAHQVFQCASPMLTVVDRLERIESQQFGQLQRVDSIAAATLYPVVIWVTGDHSPNHWFDDVVEPGGVVAFFESEMNFTAQVPEEISHRLGRGLDHRPSYEFAMRIQDGNGDGYLVDIQSDVVLSHRALLISGKLRVGTTPSYHLRGALSHISFALGPAW